VTVDEQRMVDTAVRRERSTTQSQSLVLRSLPDHLLVIVSEILDGTGTHGAVIYVYRPYELPANVYAIVFGTGRSQLWKQLVPADTAGITVVRPPRISDDGICYAYNLASPKSSTLTCPRLVMKMLAGLMSR